MENTGTLTEYELEEKAQDVAKEMVDAALQACNDPHLPNAVGWRYMDMHMTSFENLEEPSLNGKCITSSMFLIAPQYIHDSHMPSIEIESHCDINEGWASGRVKVWKAYNSGPKHSFTCERNAEGRMVATLLADETTI